jgi:hypothetical protein
METIEECREFWVKLAKENGWYYEPFFIQVMKNEDGKIIDSVAHRDMSEDIIMVVNYN